MSYYHETKITEDDEDDPVIYNLMEDIRCLKEELDKYKQTSKLDHQAQKNLKETIAHLESQLDGKETALKQYEVELEVAKQKLDEAKEILATVKHNMETRLVRGFDHDKGEYPITEGTITLLLLEKKELQAQLEDANEKLRWREPTVERPEHGVPVLIKRSNGIVDRAEISELYFDGHPAWYTPWGPVPYDDQNILGWLPIPDTAPQEGEV